MQRFFRINLILSTLWVCLGCDRDMPQERFSTMSIFCPMQDTDLDKDYTSAVVTYSEESQRFTDEEAFIRLRGNSTAGFPKRPFRIKLSDAYAIEKMPKARSWILLANWLDKTMIRNALAFRMAEDTRLDYTPHASFVELNYNNLEKGIYQIAEQIQVHRNRLNLSSMDWLVEIDARATPQDVTFRTAHIPQPFCIRYPEIEQGDEQAKEIEQIFVHAEEVLFSNNFKDKELGWRKYMDEDSFVDWYLINEISKNNDATFFSSCYIHSAPDGKLRMGPLWDFDIAFGNAAFFGANDSPYGFYIRNTEWYTRLWEDEDFVNKVRTQFAELYNNRQTYYTYVHSNAKRIRPYINKEDSIWHQLSNANNNITAEQAFNAEIDKLINWLDIRLEWLNQILNK